MDETNAEEHRSDLPWVIIIHGWGGTYLEAIDSVRDLVNIRCCWLDGVFHLPKREGMVVRKILQEQEPDRTITAFQTLVVSQLLASCVPPLETPPAADSVRIHESQLLEDFAHLGIPLAPGARLQRSTQLQAMALADLEPILPRLETLRAELQQQDGTRLSELEAAKVIRTLSPEQKDRVNLLPLLSALRDMHETGGDLDTVCSGVFYAWWVQQKAKAEDRPCRYGRDWRFAFINYHEGITSLAEHAPCRVLMADLPIGALPDFDTQVQALREKKVYLERFEDHHPYTEEQINMLQQMRCKGQLDFLAMSGPLVGQECAEEELLCAADMVHDSCIVGQEWETPGTRTLRTAAHAEDFVTDRHDLSRLLTELIKGGSCKVQLAEIMLASIPDDDLSQRLKDHGLDAVVAEWRTYVDEVESALLENAYVLHIPRPEGCLGELGGLALGEGSDMPQPPRPQEATIKILIAMAYQNEPGKPKLTTGRAIEFYARHMPDVDYAFYAWGSSLMVMRRLNQADISLNLSQIAPELGGEGDGGHAGASVCRPDANPAYPKHLLKRVDARTFRNFAKYLSRRLAALNLPTVQFEDRSVHAGTDLHSNGTKVARITGLALVLGLLLLLLPRFNSDAIRETNQDFMPQLQDQMAPSDAEGQESREPL